MNYGERSNRDAYPAYFNWLEMLPNVRPNSCLGYDRSDDRNRAASCDQAIFDGGRAAIVIPETPNKLSHQKSLRFVAPERTLLSPIFR